MNFQGPLTYASKTQRRMCFKHISWFATCFIPFLSFLIGSGETAWGVCFHSPTSHSTSCLVRPPTSLQFSTCSTAPKGCAGRTVPLWRALQALNFLSSIGGDGVASWVKAFESLSKISACARDLLDAMVLEQEMGLYFGKLPTEWLTLRAETSETVLKMILEY